MDVDDSTKQLAREEVDQYYKEKLDKQQYQLANGVSRNDSLQQNDSHLLMP